MKKKSNLYFTTTNRLINNITVTLNIYLLLFQVSSLLKKNYYNKFYAERLLKTI